MYLTNIFHLYKIFSPKILMNTGGDWGNLYCDRAVHCGACLFCEEPNQTDIKLENVKLQLTASLHKEQRCQIELQRTEEDLFLLRAEMIRVLNRQGGNHSSRERTTSQDLCHDGARNEDIYLHGDHWHLPVEEAEMHCIPQSSSKNYEEYLEAFHPPYHLLPSCRSGHSLNRTLSEDENLKTQARLLSMVARQGSVGGKTKMSLVLGVPAVDREAILGVYSPSNLQPIAVGLALQQLISELYIAEESIRTLTWQNTYQQRHPGEQLPN